MDNKIWTRAMCVAEFGRPPFYEDAIEYPPNNKYLIGWYIKSQEPVDSDVESQPMYPLYRRALDDEHFTLFIYKHEFIDHP